MRAAEHRVVETLLNFAIDFTIKNKVTAVVYVHACACVMSVSCALEMQQYIDLSRIVIY